MLLRTDIGQGIRDTVSATPDNRVAKPLAMLTMERSVSWCVCDYVLSDYHAYTDDTLAPTKQYLRTQGLKKSSSIFCFYLLSGFDNLLGTWLFDDIRLFLDYKLSNHITSVISKHYNLILHIL